jgi:hypothetical protein
MKQIKNHNFFKGGIAMATLGIILCVYALLVLILMEIAVDKENPRGANGKLRIKMDGWVIEILYKTNVWRGTDDTKPIQEPKSICQMFRGIFWGAPYSILSTIVACMGVVIFFIIRFVVTLFFGYAIKKENFFDQKRVVFNKYERYGENGEKKYVAPWKFVLIASNIWVCWTLYENAKNLYAENMVKGFAWYSFSTIFSWLLWGGSIIGVIYLGAFLMDVVPKHVTYDSIKRIKEKACPGLEAVRQQGK